MSDIRATLFKKFVAAFPTPEGVVWNDEQDCFLALNANRSLSSYSLSELRALEHNSLFDGYQAAYAEAVRDQEDKIVDARRHAKVQMLNRAAEFCYSVPSLETDPERQQARDKMRNGIHDRIQEEIRSLTDERSSDGR